MQASQWCIGSCKVLKWKRHGLIVLFLVFVVIECAMIARFLPIVKAVLALLQQLLQLQLELLPSEWHLEDRWVLLAEAHQLWMSMFIVLVGVVAFLADLLVQQFILLNASRLFRSSEACTLSYKPIADVVREENVAVLIAIQPHILLLCSILQSLFDNWIWVVFVCDDSLDAFEFASTASKAGDGHANTKLPQAINWNVNGWNTSDGL